MDVKRIVRGPWLWIAVAVVGVLLVLQVLSSNGGYSEITTSKMTCYITNGDIKKVTFVDGDQAIQAELDNGKKVTATFVEGTQEGLVNEVEAQIKAGKIESYNGDLAKQSFFGTLLFTLLADRV